jgi:hypothetical protein
MQRSTQHRQLLRLAGVGRMPWAAHFLGLVVSDLLVVRPGQRSQLQLLLQRPVLHRMLEQQLQPGRLTEAHIEGMVTGGSILMRQLLRIQATRFFCIARVLMVKQDAW